MCIPNSNDTDVSGRVLTNLSEAHQSEIRAALAQLRKQLLDLTAHNPLISFKHAKSGRYIRLVDELPDLIIQQLYDGKMLAFASVPEPSADELERWKDNGGDLIKMRPPVVDWAKKCGISDSYDLPLKYSDLGDRHHTNVRLQTLHYPDILEAKVSNLYRITRTMVEETGTNALHLTFGFLEWFESDSSEKAHHAPLYTLPVALEKGEIERRTNTYQYTLRIREDEVQFNASIARRLLDDYQFVLPEIDPEQLPEDYLSVVEEAIKARFPRWKVLRWGTLAMLNFSRLLMYRDLDPDNWPEGHALDGHPLVNAVIRRTDVKDGENAETISDKRIQTEYAIDDLKDIHDNYPLVDVADSSQHSALIDAISGRNLVIQGPPGTGKSQTITNLIAAALCKGKSVLFVSEKLAALNVVKHRMEKLGLGEFCLELHSHNTKKMGVVESIKQRYEKKYRDTRRLDELKERHGKLVRELNAHAERVNQPWKNTGITILEILVRCARYRKELHGEWEKLRIDRLTGDSWTSGHHAETLIEFEAYLKQLTLIGSELPDGVGIDSHPWRGIYAADLDGGSISQIMKLLRDWEESLKSLVQTVSALPGGHDDLIPRTTLNDVESLSNAIALMPNEVSDVDWTTLEIIHERGLCELDDLAKARHKLIESCINLGSLSLDKVVESKDILELEQVVDGLLGSGISPVTPLSSFKIIGNNSEEILTIIDRWSRRFSEYREYINNEVPPLLDPMMLSIDGLIQLQEIIGMNRKLMPKDINHRSERLLPNKCKEKLQDLKEQIQLLRNQREKHAKVFDLMVVRKSLDLGTIQKIVNKPSVLKRLFSQDYWKARKAIKAVMINPKEDWNPMTISSSLQDLESYFNLEDALASDFHWANTLGTAFQGIDTELERIDRIVGWHAELEERFRKADVSLFSDTELNASGNWLLEANERCFDAIMRFNEADLSNDIERIQYLFQLIIQVYDHHEIPNQAAIGNPHNEWLQLLGYLKEAVPNLLAHIPAFGENPPKTIGLAQKRLRRYLSIRESWAEHHAIFNEINANYFAERLPNEPLPPQVLIDAVAHTRQWCEWLDHPQTPRALSDEVKRRASKDFPSELRSWNERARQTIVAELSMREAFINFVSLQSEEWSNDGDLGVLNQRIAEAAKTEELLPNYLTFLRVRAILISKGFAKVCDQAERSGLPKIDIKSVYELLVASSLADEIFAENRMLRRFDGTMHTHKLADFRQCDQELLNQSKIRVAAQISNRDVPQGNRGARVSDHTDLELILREMEKQKRHIPLRQLLLRAGKAVQALKPCFMMGPRSVAQYLKPGSLEFDLLVIDEASQMRPADALGAVARCNQLVVVGDSKQLAPTSFFDRAIESDEEDEDQFEATVSESILDAVAPVFSRRQLRWHYRSRHPSLIAFSNRHFYENRLMLFPSPHYDGEALGIRCHYVNQGVFCDQVNVPEAQQVADRVRQLLLENSSLSLGVATMNSKQRDLVERLLEDHAKKDKIFAQALEVSLGNDEPLFIKNLENVQGDERDVMIISCTYGRNAAGVRVMQRFGPINSTEGGRRLNVLFTRSRFRMEIFTSMLSSDVVVSEQSSEGVLALRGILRYAESGAIEGAKISGREPDSDFEIAVAQILQDHGYEVACQIGVAGFFIDIGVKHPERDGEYILGVECDGAAYHSSKSARDRDRIRQEVLESMGWTINRIWSTDWFRDPNKAIKPVLETIQMKLNYKSSI